MILYRLCCSINLYFLDFLVINFPVYIVRLHSLVYIHFYLCVCMCAWVFVFSFTQIKV